MGSLLLSAVAIAVAVGPNRDGMLYVETARIFLDQGWMAARANFDWPFLPVLIGLLSTLTGLQVQSAGFLLGALLMAAVCAILVRVTQCCAPKVAWACVLVVLALPGFNAYRDHIIREFGFWLFALTAILTAIRWDASPGWWRALGIHAAIGVAIAFRLEAVFLYPAIIGWQLFRRGDGQLRRLVMVAIVPALGVTAGAAVLVGQGDAMHHRIAYYLTAADPVQAVGHFDAAARQFADAVLNRYSADEAKSILFFGLLSIIPVKFVQLSGVFIVPLALGVWRRTPTWESGARLLLWAFALYALVLFVFLMHQFFLTGRYVSFLNLLAAPLVAVGFLTMLERYQRWRVAIVAIAILVALANVVSLGPRKTQYRDAGEWLAANFEGRLERIMVEDGRIAYYAGWPMAMATPASTGADALAVGIREGRYDLIVLDVRRRNDDAKSWIATLPVTEVNRFTNRAGDAVVVLKPAH